MAGLEPPAIMPTAYIKIKENGQFSFIGFYNFTLDRNVDANGNPAGEYIFRHNIGDEDYTVMVTGCGFSVYGSVVAKSATLFVISLFTFNGAKSNGNFDVLVFKT